MIQLREKPFQQAACNNEAVFEGKELSILADYLCWTITVANAEMFKALIPSPFILGDRFDFRSRHDLRPVYRKLLWKNHHLAEARKLMLRCLFRRDVSISEMELTVFYSGLAEGNIDRAVDNSDSRPLVWLVQQCITLCDHLVRQTYLLEETKVAIEEAKLSDWLQKQSEKRWEPGVSSFNNGSFQVNNPDHSMREWRNLSGSRVESEGIDYLIAAEAEYFEAEATAMAAEAAEYEAEAESMAEEPDLEACAEEEGDRESGASSYNSGLPQEAHPSREPLTTESQESEELAYEECSDCPADHEDERRKIDYQKMEFYITSLVAIFCGVSIVGAMVMIVVEAVESVNRLNVNSREKQELVIAERFVRNA